LTNGDGWRKDPVCIYNSHIINELEQNQKISLAAGAAPVYNYLQVSCIYENREPDAKRPLAGTPAPSSGKREREMKSMSREGVCLGAVAGFGRVYDCGDCGNIHVQVGPVNLTLEPAAYMQFVALLSASAANFELWMHERRLSCCRAGEEPPAASPASKSAEAAGGGRFGAPLQAAPGRPAHHRPPARPAELRSLHRLYRQAVRMTQQVVAATPHDPGQRRGRRARTVSA
jgi:hypothetical protein